MTSQAHPSDSRFVLVPREPTPAILEAIFDRLDDGQIGEDYSAADVYAAMLSAAPGGEGEPVAWRWSVDLPGATAREVWRHTGSTDEVANLREAGVKVQPLFTDPPEPVAWRPDRAEERDYPEEFEKWWMRYKHRNRTPADYSLKKQIAFDAFHFGALTAPPPKGGA